MNRTLEQPSLRKSMYALVSSCRRRWWQYSGKSTGDLGAIIQNSTAASPVMVTPCSWLVIGSCHDLFPLLSMPNVSKRPESDRDRTGRCRVLNNCRKHNTIHVIILLNSTPCLVRVTLMFLAPTLPVSGRFQNSFSSRLHRMDIIKYRYTILWKVHSIVYDKLHNISTRNRTSGVEQ